MAHSGLPLEPGDTWFIYLAVHDPVRDERLNWWVRAVLVNTYDGTRGRMDLAFRYVGFANELQSGLPVWQTIPEDGVGLIATWVFLRSLELTREGKDLD
jgi:hypothetical protein